MRRSLCTSARPDARRVRRLSLPILTTTLLASFTLSASTAQAADCAGANLLPAIASIATAKSATLCLLNDQRAAHGLAPLSTQPVLEAAAHDYSLAMVQQRFFAHVAPSGETITERLASYVASARSWITGENLAWGQGSLATPSAIVRGWMESSSHRENILNGRFQEIGIGIVGGTPSGGLPALSATYTTEFGARAVASPSAAPTRTSASSARSAPAAKKKAAKRISAKKKKQISKRCHRVARRTKASKKTRQSRYDRCMRTQIRAEQKRQSSAAKKRKSSAAKKR